MSQRKHKVVNLRNKDTKKMFLIKAITFESTNKCTRTFLQVCTALSGFAAKRTSFHRVSYEYCECENVCVGVYLSLHRSP